MSNQFLFFNYHDKLGEVTLRWHRDYLHNNLRLWRIACTAKEPMAINHDMQLNRPIVRELQNTN